MFDAVVKKPLSGVRLIAIVSILAAFAIRLNVASAAEQTAPSSAFNGLEWRSIGPFRGGRATAATGVPGSPDVFYFGAAAGGVWKTIDAGASWQPIFDSQSTASIGAIAVAPSNPQVIYVGTGESALRGNVTWGGGVFKSEDGGATWKNVGLRDSRQIGALIVDPKNSDVALVAALGHAFGPNSERGVYRTADGGKSWQRVLYRDDLSGAIDVTFDPNDSHIVYAALWQVRRQPWNFSSGGVGSGLYRAAALKSFSASASFPKRAYSTPRSL